MLFANAILLHIKMKKNYIETSTIMLLILFFIIILMYIYTNSTTKLFNKEIWPIKKEERLNKLIIYEATDKYKDRSVFDPYSITHISHGILFYYIMNYINPKQNQNNLYISLLIETTWEILENTTLIKIYREYDKYSENYIGDSIVNILSDIIFMIIGFLFASKYKFSAFMFFIVSEIILYIKIKDNLTKSIKDIIINLLL